MPTLSSLMLMHEGKADWIEEKQGANNIVFPFPEK